ncbi:CHAD domain-containing protein [Roseomonas sp. E05]|uniref:CYTH and CHAD domain-containing protein n=1 Tax=Roseomonas sp. E05 TaxID=3046310 RepID=UPI0024B91CB1|nr:CHAD domain-containing protein [Roseomonas sp. E05]MDJ0390503.1 CHAD domain-containing protein [Roseomonas sp. E05]
MLLHLRLALPADAAMAIWRHAALTGRRRPRATAEQWAWLDSAEDILAKAGLALRSPPQGGRRLCRLEPPAGFRLPGTPAGEPELLPAGTAPPEAGGAALAPVARYAGRLQQSVPDAAGVTLRLRIGTLAAGDMTRAVALLELEGPDLPVLDLAAALAEDLPLLPAVSGLDAMALALRRGAAAPQHGRRGPPDLGAAEAAEDALALAIAHLTDVLLAHAPAARPESGPEAVHQLRVAARRLRSCLRLFRPALDGPALRVLDALLRDFARALGEAREWDVFLGELGAELAAALGPDRRWEQLLRAAEARRQAAYAQLRAMLDGPAFRALVWQAVRTAALRTWDLPEGTEAAPPLRGLAAELLTRRHRKLLKEGRNLESLSDEARHELRLKAKRLRYAAELFAPLWPGKPARRFLKRIAALQQALGLANDTVTARALVASLGRAAPAWAVGLAEGWALAATRGVRQESLPAWRRFARLDPFWKPE